MDRTIVVQLNPSPEQRAALDRTMQEHTACFNTVAREGFKTGCSNGVELHKRTYSPLRQEYPDLPAQLVCAARVKATEAVTSAFTWKKKHAARYPKLVEKAKKQGKPVPPFKPVRCPQSKSAPIRYDQRSYWVKWESLTASLATVAGHVEMGFRCKHQARNNRRSQSLFLCHACGYCLHADLNASINIREKHLATLGTSLDGGSPVKRPIVSTLRSEMQAYPRKAE